MVLRLVRVSVERLRIFYAECRFFLHSLEDRIQNKQKAGRNSHNTPFLRPLPLLPASLLQTLSKKGRSHRLQTSPALGCANRPQKQRRKRCLETTATALVDPMSASKVATVGRPTAAGSEEDGLLGRGWRSWRLFSSGSCGSLGRASSSTMDTVPRLRVSIRTSVQSERAADEFFV